MDTAKDTPAEQHRMEKEDIEDLGTVTLSRGGHVIHCLTVIGQIEGHTEAPQGQKTTKYEHVIPQLVAVQEDPRIEGLLVLLNTVGGDVEAGLALAELIASVSKPSATLVLGGGHSIGIPLAVSARHSFIVPTATMTVHPVRHSGLILGVPQTMHCFEQMQQRITGFVAAHSGMPEKRYTQLMLHTGELVMDMGTVLDGRRAVKEKLIDELGGLSDALAWLYKEPSTRLRRPTSPRWKVASAVRCAADWSLQACSSTMVGSSSTVARFLMPAATARWSRLCCIPARTVSSVAFSVRSDSRSSVWYAPRSARLSLAI